MNSLRVKFVGGSAARAGQASPTDRVFKASAHCGKSDKRCGAKKYGYVARCASDRSNFRRSTTATASPKWEYSTNLLENSSRSKASRAWFRIRNQQAAAWVVDVRGFSIRRNGFSASAGSAPTKDATRGFSGKQNETPPMDEGAGYFGQQWILRRPIKPA